MANLTPAATFDSVYQFETTDLIQGGPGGTDNIPHQQLLNRTQWLFANKLALDGSQPMTGGLVVNAGAGTVLTLTTPNTVDAVIRMTQNAQTALTVKALAGGVMSIGVDTSTGDTERVRINSSGNVGIGIASAGNTLQLYKAGAVANYLHATNGATGPGTGNGLLVGVDASGNGVINAQGAVSLQTFVAGGERMRIDSSGNVVIGNATALSKLDVVGLDGNGIQYRTGTRTIGIGSFGGLSTLYSGSGTEISFNIGGERMRVDSSGNVGIGRAPGVSLDVQSASAAIIRARGGSGAGQGAGLYITLPASDSTMAAFGDRSTAFGGTPGNIASIYTSAAIPLTFDVAAAERMRINASGNVGIGTGSPGDKLTVNPSITIESGAGVAPTLTLAQSGTANWTLRSLAGSGSFAIRDAVAGADRITVAADGTVTLSGALSGTSGTFSSTLNAASGGVTAAWTVGTTLTVTSSILGGAVIKTTSSQGFQAEVPNGSSPVIRLQQTGQGDWRMEGVASSTRLRFTENGNERASLGASGASATFNSGIATPSNSLGTTSGTVTVNCALSNVHRVTLNGNMTLALSNPSDGQTINLFITQDATGSRTATWPSSVKWPGGTAGVLSTAANSVDLVVLTYLSATGFYYASLLKRFS